MLLLVMLAVVVAEVAMCVSEREVIQYIFHKSISLGKH